MLSILTGGVAMIAIDTKLRGPNRHTTIVTTRSIDKYPPQCPICLHAIGPIDTEEHWLFEESRLEIVLHCPRPECEHYFVARYAPIEPKSNRYSFSEAVPLTLVQGQRSDLIKDISPDFVAIHREAEEADLRNLKLICGPGYRKALEFLIKDYVISLNPKRAEGIRKMNLGKCISDFVQNNKVKEVAERATWLGNDETHYLRKWDQKDVNDLKNLIELTVLWIEMEARTEKAIKDMPKGKA